MYLYLHQQTAPYYDITGHREPDMALLDSMVECVIRSRFSNSGITDMLTTMLVDKLTEHMDMPVNLDFPYGFEVEKYYCIHDIAKSLGSDKGLLRMMVSEIPNRFYDPYGGMGLILHNHGQCLWTIIGNEHFTF